MCSDVQVVTYLMIHLRPLLKSSCPVQTAHEGRMFWRQDFVFGGKCLSVVSSEAQREPTKNKNDAR